MLKFSPLYVIPLLRNLLFHVAYVSEFDVTCMASSFQGRPEKLGGPGQRVKEGPQGKEGSTLNHNFSLTVSRRPK